LRKPYEEIVNSVLTTWYQSALVSTIQAVCITQQKNCLITSIISFGWPSCRNRNRNPIKRERDGIKH